MKKLTLRIAGVIAVLAAVVVPATEAAATPQGGAVSVTCPDGSSGCTRYGYSYSIPNSTGLFTIYYTVKWSSTGGSYRVVKAAWVNNTSRTVFWQDFGVHAGTAAFSGYGTLMNGNFSVGSGASYSFVESQFNGVAKGVYIPKNQNAYAVAAEVDPTVWQYHNSSLVSTTAPFLMG